MPLDGERRLGRGFREREVENMLEGWRIAIAECEVNEDNFPSLEKRWNTLVSSTICLLSETGHGLAPDCFGFLFQTISAIVKTSRV